MAISFGYIRLQQHISLYFIPRTAANAALEGCSSVVIMSAKREMEETDGETPEPQTKRAKPNSSKTRQHQHSGIDPTWGQKYVFSSSENATTIPAGEESEFEDDSDAMAYLMSVR